MAGNGVWVFLVGVLIAGALGGWRLAGESNAGFANDAAVLAFVGLLAIAIERVIEIWWTLLGHAKAFGAWWPMKQISEAAAVYEKQADALLAGADKGATGGVFHDVTSALAAARAQFRSGSDEFKKFDGALGDLKKQHQRLVDDLASARTLAPGSSRLSLVASVVDKASDVLQKGVKDSKAVTGTAVDSLETAIQAADRALSFVESIKTNPAKQVASIVLGVGLGMALAGFMSVNMFAAALADEAGPTAGVIGVLLTGIVIGLGSNPTHELVKALQRYKESKNPVDRVRKAEEEKQEQPAQPVTAEALAKLEFALDVVDHERERLTKTGAGLNEVASFLNSIKEQAPREGGLPNLELLLALQSSASDALGPVRLALDDVRSQLKAAAPHAVAPSWPAQMDTNRGDGRYVTIRSTD